MKNKPKKNITTRLEEIYLIVLWVILFPFVFLFKLLKIIDTQDKKNAFKEIRQLLADNKITDYADLFRLLYDEVDGYGKGHVAECILIIERYELSDSQVVDKEINAMAMLIEILQEIR